MQTIVVFDNRDLRYLLTHMLHINNESNKFYQEYTDSDDVFDIFTMSKIDFMYCLLLL